MILAMQKHVLCNAFSTKKNFIKIPRGQKAWTISKKQKKQAIRSQQSQKVVDNISF